MTILADISIGDILLIITLLIMIWQTWLLRKEMKANVILDLYSKWNEIGKMEVEYPKFHKMLMKREILDELINLTEEQLKERALSYMVFDVFSMIYLEKKSKVFEGVDQYIKGIMTNPTMIKCWKDYQVRKAWDGFEFQTYIDKIIIDYEKKQKIINNLPKKGQKQ